MDIFDIEKQLYEIEDELKYWSLFDDSLSQRKVSYLNTVKNKLMNELNNVNNNGEKENVNY